MRTLSCVVVLSFLGFAAISTDAKNCYGRYRLYLGRLIMCRPAPPILIPQGQRLPVLQPLPGAIAEIGLEAFGKGVYNNDLTNLLISSELTVFGPTDEAFAAYYAEQPQDAELDMVDLIKAHLVLGSITSDMFENDQQLTTLADSVIRMNVYNTDRFMTANCARVLTADKRALNGIIHVIDAVIPPVTETISQIAEGDDSLSIFSKALDVTGLKSSLNEPGLFTVFAPSNDAFEKLGEENLNAFLTSPRCLLLVLQNHVIPQTMCSVAVTDDEFSTAGNLLGKDIEFTVVDEDIFVNGARFVVRDIVATNGVIHVIDTVLMPPEARNVVDMAIDAGATRAMELVAKAGLGESFKGTDGITLLVPSNDAIDSLPEDVQAKLEDPEYLRSVMNYHVATAELEYMNIVDGVKLSTFNADANISVYDFQATPAEGDLVRTAQCARMSANADQQNIEACNGIVHVMDQVMFPPPGNIMAVLEANPDRFSSLTMLIRQAGLESVFTAAPHYTIFAPTNEAIDNLDKYTLNCLSAYPDMLRDVLLYHVTSGSLCCAGIYPSDYNPTVSTMTGSLLSLCKIDGKVVVGGADVTRCDFTATNGVVHAIDRVLPGALNKYVSLYTARSLQVLGLYYGYGK